MKTATILSLFTGAGALDYGFELSGGFVTRLCLETQPEFCETLRLNQSAGVLPSADIRQTDVADPLARRAVVKEFGVGRFDGILGGPPCEGFSTRGMRLEASDPRSQLVWEYANWVQELRPSFFVLENVPRLVEIEDGQFFHKLITRLTLIGYSISSKILRACDYGAATIRRRLFVVGFPPGNNFVFPEPTHGTPDLFHSSKPFVTVREAFRGLVRPTNVPPGKPTGHFTISHSANVIERFRGLRQGQRDYIRQRIRLHLEQPAPCLIAGNLSGIRSHIHPSEPRELTNRESARLHGFPDWFCFSGGHASMGKQIANSVPIPLAEALGRAAYDQLYGPAERNRQSRAKKQRRSLCSR